MTWLKWLIGVPVGLALLVLAAGQFGLLSGRQPTDLGVRDGKLKRPSSTPNSVSSQARQWPGDVARAAYVDPLALPAGLDASATMKKIEGIVASMDGATVVESRPDYIYARCTTRLLRYVDDVEFWFDAAQGVVQVRSASRVGRKDFGVNRARIEAVRARL